MVIFQNISFYKPNKAGRIALYLAFSIILMTGIEAKAQEIQSASIIAPVLDQYTIENIEVDITADNAVEAREKAFEVAQIKAYEELARRLLDAEAYKEFETPDINVISNYVQNYEVKNEKLSAVRYNGTYEIQFSQRAIDHIQKKQKITDDRNIIEAVSQNGDTLILPLYQRSGRTFLWQANPFMQAWVRARNNSNINAIVPIGDINDIKQIRDGQGLSYDPSRLNAMRLRYNAERVVILTVEPAIQPDGRNTMMLKIYDAQPYGPVLKAQSIVPAYAGEVEDQLYNRLVNESLKSLAQMNVADPSRSMAVLDNNVNDPQAMGSQAYNGATATITTQVNFSSVREWVQMKKTIETLPNVSSVIVQSMSPRAAVLNIKFKGGEENLRQGLSQKGLVLNNAPQGQIYQIMRGQNLNSSVYVPQRIAPSAAPSSAYSANF